MMDWSSFFSAVVGGLVGALATIVVERIKARISGEFWVAQERWKLKRDIYTQLLTVLSKQRRYFDELAHRLRDYEPHQTLPPELEGDIIQMIHEKAGPLAAQVAELQAVARLWVRPATFNALDRSRDGLRKNGTDNKFAERIVASLDNAIELVAEEAGRDLKLEVRGS